MPILSFIDLLELADPEDVAHGLFDYLPAQYGLDWENADPFVQRWLRGLAGEIALLRAYVEAIRSSTIPATADDTLGALRAWEDVLKVPPRPWPNPTVEERREAVLAALQTRNVAGRGDLYRAVLLGTGVEIAVAANTPAPGHATISGGPPDNAAYVAFVTRRMPADQVLHFV